MSEPRLTRTTSDVDIPSDYKSNGKDLFTAAKDGDVDQLRYLIVKEAENPSRPNFLDSQYTALHYAAWRNQLPAVRFLIRKGVPVDVRSTNGWTPLHSAANVGAAEVVRCLVKEAHCDPNITYEGLQTPLHLAASLGELATVQCLIEDCRADPNSQDSLGRTALSVAKDAHRTEVAEYLSSRTASSNNIEDLLSGCFNLPSDYKSNGKDLFAAAKEGDVIQLRFLVECEGVNPSQKNESYFGDSALHCAARSGCLPAVRYLIFQGVRVDIRDEAGWTPLHSAANLGAVSVVRCLVLEARCDANITRSDKQTALHLASAGGQLAVAKCLVEECRANVNARDEADCSPLALAVEREHNDVAEYLRSHGAN